MIGAKALLDGIRQDLQPVREQLLGHPYVKALEEGQIEREKLRLFAGEQYSIIASDLKSVAYLLSRFGSAPSRDFFLGILQGERAAWDGLLTFVNALGLSEAQLEQARASGWRSCLHLLHGVACALCLCRRDCCCLPGQFSSVGSELWPPEPDSERAFRYGREGSRFF